MSKFQLYSFCLIVTASLVGLLSMSTDFFVSYINNIIIPCQHDSSWTGTNCNCDNTRGVFSGQYCGACECKHYGICTISTNHGSRWGCRCPNNQKWSGTLCDKCYAVDHNESLNMCSGPCLTTDTHVHYGAKCDTVCIVNSSTVDPVCSEISSGGGVCNACNGHGTCTGTGQCACDQGWFNSFGGEQCDLSCSSKGINCPTDKGICTSIGGEIQCICRPGFYGANCELTCESINDEPCSGHGTCGLTSLGAPTCTCDTHYIGNMCQYVCPGDTISPSSCSGHGKCLEGDNKAVCHCRKDSNWLGYDCSCNEQYTCSGHGKCQPDASCLCNEWSTPSEQHWNGTLCQKCQEHWYGSECQMYCNPDEIYLSDIDAGRQNKDRTDGQQIGCNTRGSCKVIKVGNKEHMECSCLGMDPESFCGKCEKYQFPKTTMVNTSVDWCSETCGEKTCNSGICNEGYTGSNNLCICNNITIGSNTLDTLDPVQYCKSCRENWHPSTGSNRCTRYCAKDGQLEGEIIVFGVDSDTRDYQLNGDIDAQSVCVANEHGFSPDADCRICSGEGTCNDNAQCSCKDGVTGIYCEVDCGEDSDGIVCSGHGRCIRNDLDMWFDPYTKKSRCECIPYDTYTSETRQRLIKRGFQVESPPDPNFYGEYCDYHCPRYNQKICTGRGTCKPRIAVPEVGENAGRPRGCFNDTECTDIPGAFCARLSTPWDSLMNNSKSFFSNGIVSPGYSTCAKSSECIDSIYSIKWDEYCVNMLSGWYPPVLNTAQCTYKKNSSCLSKVEDFFAQKSSNSSKTWCQQALEKLKPDKTNCGSTSSQSSFYNTICIGYDSSLSCNAQEMCIYEQRIQSIQNVDDECRQKTSQSVCDGVCKWSKGGCVTKTYCRAKTCEDAFSSNSIESLCVKMDPPTSCDSDSSESWPLFCAQTTGQLRPTSSMSVKDTFFSCMMLQNSINPQTVISKIPGGIRINGEKTIEKPIQETTAIQEFRQKFIESRTLIDTTTCAFLSDKDMSDFCEQKLKVIIPNYSKPNDSTDTWFYEWLVVCPKDSDIFFYKDSVHKEKKDAINRVLTLAGRMCTIHYKCIPDLTNSWSGSCVEPDSDDFEVTPYKLECLEGEGTNVQYLNTLDYSKYPIDPTSCVLNTDHNMLRWGGVKWPVEQLTDTFESSCKLDASWIPQKKAIPSLCDLGACGQDSTMCMECPDTLTCHSGVLCGSQVNVDCSVYNPCGEGGHCYVPENFFATRYLCEWEHTNVRVFVDNGEYNGELTPRGDLTVFQYVPVDTTVVTINLTIVYNNTWSSQLVEDWHITDVVNIGISGLVDDWHIINVGNSIISGLETFNTSGLETFGLNFNKSGPNTLIHEVVIGITSGLNTSGLNTSGLNTSGLNTSGLNTSGLNTSGLETLNNEIIDLFCPSSHQMVHSCTNCSAYTFERGYYCSSINSTCTENNYGCPNVKEPVIPTIINQCPDNNGFNWFEYCDEEKERMGHSLSTLAPDALISPWTGTAKLLEANVVWLDGSVEFDSFMGPTNFSVTIYYDPESALILTMGTVEYVIDSSTYTDIAEFTIVRNLTTMTVTSQVPSTNYKLTPKFGTILISSIQINDEEQVKLYNESFNDRNIYKGTDSVNYESWSFDKDGSMMFRRQINDDFIDKKCTLSEGVTTCPIEDVNKGSMWDLPEGWELTGTTENQTPHGLRFHGWSKFDNGGARLAQFDETSDIVNMNILNGDKSVVVGLSVRPVANFDGGRVYVNDRPTQCYTTMNNWWHWQIDIEANGNHVRNISETEMYINRVLIEPNTAFFTQQYTATVRIGSCEYTNNTISIKTSVRELMSRNLIGTAFHNLNSGKHECRQHCHGHVDCVQWSWTPQDQHCYLHSSRCHEEDTCVLGTHHLRALHPQNLTHFEVYNEAPNIKTWWNFIRVEPLLTLPSEFVCPVLNITEQVPLLWQERFRSIYEPFNVDATSICNTIQTQWETIPGYTSGVCEGQACDYNSNDISACALAFKWKTPTVTNNGIDNNDNSDIDCKEDVSTFQNLDWRSYCFYQQSFVPEDGNKIDFLGDMSLTTNNGIDIQPDGVKTSFEMMCQESFDIMNNDTQCEIDIPWFEKCFDRTVDYERFCPTDCIQDIERMLDEVDDDPSICTQRQKFLDINNEDKMSQLGLQHIEDCDGCELDIIITDFCTLQQTYHTDDNKVHIPELYNSDCGGKGRAKGCLETLQDSMGRIVFRNWCEDLSKGRIQGTCSKTVCECDTKSYAGVAGGVCELTCPTGMDGDEELACSGRNGQCFANSPNEVTFDSIRQQNSDEYRSPNVSNPFMPKWEQGPSPSVAGRCQCALGSGMACSIPCDRCNNGTYGYDMVSQYGICDSFNGICRGLAPFMRYNTKYVGDNDYTSFNTTAFDNQNGKVFWVYPERFLYESDEVLLGRISLYINDNDGLIPEELKQTQLDVPSKLRVNFVLESFRDICWNFSAVKNYTDFDYTSNDENVTFRGIDVTTSRTMTSTTIPSADTCTLILIEDDDFHLCFHNGKINAHNKTDNSPLMVLEKGNENIPLIGMTFCWHSPGVVYGFGGSIRYPSTTDYYNTMYKIEVERHNWEPYDVIMVRWNLVRINNNIVPPMQQSSPIVCYDEDIYLISESERDDTRTVWSFLLPTRVQNGRWNKKQDVISSGQFVNVKKEPGRMQLIYENASNRTAVEYTFSTDGDSVTNPSTTANVTDINEFEKITTTYSSPGGIQTCDIQLDGSQAKIGGNVIATSTGLPTSIKIFIEEWTTIDVASGADIYTRFANTIQFHNEKTKNSDLSLTDIQTDIQTDSQKLHILSLFERIYMHQGRWELNTMVFTQYKLSQILWSDNTYFMIPIPVSSRYNDKFNNIFDLVPLGFFESPIVTDDIDISVDEQLATIEDYKIAFEGLTPERVVIISGNNISGTYKQQVYIGNNVLHIETQWDLATFEITLSDGDGFVKWEVNERISSFVLTIPLEQWLYKTSQFTFRGQVGRDALFHLVVTKKPLHLFTMQRQLADFLSYSSSHCTTTASIQCPGVLPYAGLPCSGRGRCGISCQCVCEIAPSFLQNNIKLKPLEKPIWQNSPYRGVGCEKTCPGYDGYNLESICYGRGECQYDGTCSCRDPLRFTGDACQFECPRNELGETCSNQGGCGTRAIETSSFVFTGDEYTDGVVALNRHSYSSALTSYYGLCSEQNYVEQSATITSDIWIYGHPQTYLQLAIQNCDSTNERIRKNTSLVQNQEFRNYPFGICIGLQQIKSSDVTYFRTMILIAPKWIEYNPSCIVIFDCPMSECSFIEHPDNEAGIDGFSYKVLPASFEFTFKYVHGHSTGVEQWEVNGLDFQFETEWNVDKFKLNLSSSNLTSSSSDIVELSGEIVMVVIRIENKQMTLKKYMSFDPIPDNANVIQLAPLYENKYRRLVQEIPQYALVSDKTPTTLTEIEYHCDLEPECLGILQWNTPFREKWFTMYSDVPNVSGFEMYPVSIFNEFKLYKKMSLFYKGRTETDELCDVIQPGMSKYPSVSYTEMYDIPIDEIDLSLSTDVDTSSTIIGNGLWTNCWTRENVTTKTECKNKAVQHNCYGFGFSDDEKICIIYHKIKDTNQIQLSKYNSESRLSLYNPCDNNSTLWISV